MKNVRMRFRKEGPVKYISHLDLTRCMSRALKLSGLPVWYTEGFNPRIHMVFSPPLSLGAAGERELMDIRLLEETELTEIPERLNSRLPEGLFILEAAEPCHDLEEIRSAEYLMLLETGDPDEGLRKLDSLLKRDAIPVMKHTKKGEKEIDAAPWFRSVVSKPVSGGVELFLKLPCGPEGSVNPNLLLDALRRYENVEYHAILIRKRLLLEDNTEIY